MFTLVLLAFVPETCLGIRSCICTWMFLPRTSDCMSPSGTSNLRKGSHKGIHTRVYKQSEVLIYIALQVAQRASTENLQQPPVPSRPSSRAIAQPAAPQRPDSALPQVMHKGATQTMLNLLACQVYHFSWSDQNCLLVGM